MGDQLPRPLLRSCETLLKAFSAASDEKVELTAVFSHDVFYQDAQIDSSDTQGNCPGLDFRGYSC